jgi:CheY-like chemotaxis protein/nitrogen-specific signal transduction histidine kinase
VKVSKTEASGKKASKSQKADATKVRLFKRRSPQVTAKAEGNKTGDKRNVPRGSDAKTSAAGVVEAALAVFAHEVRTPLTGILAISDLLATSELGERERRWVDTIKAGAEHLSSLATLFVDAAKSERTGVVPRQDLFDLRVLARAAGDSLAGRAAAKGLEAEVDLSDELPSLVVGDPVRLRAALENLIDNAVKFTEQGSVVLKVLPVTGARRANKGKGKGGKSNGGGAIAFAVSDSGIGLTLQEIKRLFRPFSQANVSIASRFGGAGLGLSSVRQLARAMGGDVTVTPHPDGGTTFTLTVVLAEPAAPQPAVDGGEDGVPLAPVRSLRILGVEDNPFGRVVINTILNELGHQAEFIGRGEAAPERVEKGGLDVVLMDMVLPGINGVEAIARIRKLAPPHGEIPIIGVSGRGEDEAASRAAGANAFLLKPVSPRALATALLEVTRHAVAAT